MKIAILNTFRPFVFGNSEYLAHTLCEKLNSYGYKATIFKIPFNPSPSQKILESMLSARLLKLHNVDKVIALTFPAYLIPHHNKIIWLTQQFRQAYDLWGTSQEEIAHSVAGQQIRQMIVNSDDCHLREAKKIFTISNIAAQRLQQFNKITAEILYPPLFKPEKFYCQQYDNYLFYPNYTGSSAQQELAIEAMQYTKTPVKLLIATHPKESVDFTALQKTISESGLQNKVTVLTKKMTENQNIELMANCLACVNIPIREDYSYITLEAFCSKKTLITCIASDNLPSFIQHKTTALVSDPDAQQLADYFDQLYNDKTRAKSLGESGYEHLTRMNVNWEHVLDKLLRS